MDDIGTGLHHRAAALLGPGRRSIGVVQRILAAPPSEMGLLLIGIDLLDLFVLIQENAVPVPQPTGEGHAAGQGRHVPWRP